MGITDAKYVSFTTFRRSGEPVSTPVWLAALPDGRAGFTTAEHSGKVKRLRHTPAVTLVPCDARGKVAEGAEPVSGTAVVVGAGADYDAVAAALQRDYGIQFRLLRIGSSIRALVGRGDHTAVVVTFD